MYGRKSRFGLAAICLTFLLTLSLVSFPKLVLSQQSDNQAEEGLPGRRQGGGTRGNCSLGEKVLTALMPKNNLGLTTAVSPKLFFHMPQTSDATTVEFVLRDEEADSEVYETTFKTTGTEGIISLSLSDSGQLKSLEIGKKYHWYFSIICNAQDRANDVSVDGWIQRVEPSPTLARTLGKASPDKRAELYAATGLWQEALTTAAELRHSRPEDSAIAAVWALLLQSVGLDSIAQEPFIANYLLEHTAPNKLDVDKTDSVSVPAGRDGVQEL